MHIEGSQEACKTIAKCSTFVMDASVILAYPLRRLRLMPLRFCTGSAFAVLICKQVFQRACNTFCKNAQPGPFKRCSQPGVIRGACQSLCALAALPFAAGTVIAMLSAFQHCLPNSLPNQAVLVTHACRWTGEVAAVEAKALRKVKGDEKVHSTSIQAIREPPQVKGNPQLQLLPLLQ